MISEVFNGQNASIIALGATGSGKSFTIQVDSYFFVSFLFAFINFLLYFLDNLMHV